MAREVTQSEYEEWFGLAPRTPRQKRDVVAPLLQWTHKKVLWFAPKMVAPSWVTVRQFSDKPYCHRIIQRKDGRWYHDCDRVLHYLGPPKMVWCELEVAMNVCQMSEQAEADVSLPRFPLFRRSL